MTGVLVGLFAVAFSVWFLSLAVGVGVAFLTAFVALSSVSLTIAVLHWWDQRDDD